MDLGPQQIGKWLILTGLVIAALGVFVLALGRFGLFKLPGDLEFGPKGRRFYFPIATCIILSIILTLILRFVSRFRR